MHLDLSDEEAAALTQELHDIVENDRYPFSSRIRALREILAKLRSEPAREPLPPPKGCAPSRSPDRYGLPQCLSVDLVSVAGQAGHDAQRVAHVGKAGWKDWNVVRYARAGDFVLVTNNASDFRRLYAEQPLHAGLVILIPAVSRVLQQKLFRAALDELAVIGEPVNRVIEVDLDGEDVILTLYDLPRMRHRSPTVNPRAQDWIGGRDLLSFTRRYPGVKNVR